MTETKNELNVYSLSSKLLTFLSEMRQTPEGKAILASLRNSIGRPFINSLDVFPLIYKLLPDEYIGKGSELSFEEKSILASLQLYAMHQQGKGDSVLLTSNIKGWNNMGSALASLRNQESASVDQRFNAMITSSDFDELYHHLRQMIKLLKAKSDQCVNYAKLAEDVYWFCRGNSDSIRLNWARAYYSTQSKKKGIGEKTNEQ